MNCKNLKSVQYYSDLYDRFTVEKCREEEEIVCRIDIPDQDVTDEEKNRVKNYISNLSIHFLTGERYIKKEEIISEWMERDKKRDEFIEYAVAPNNICCLTCGRLMFVESKHLDIVDNKDRVMFFYDCPLKHKPMRSFYDNGEEYRPKIHLCIKCGGELINKSNKTKNKIVCNDTCIKCGHTEKIEFDLSDKKEVVDPNFQRDRERFCLSDKAGQEYIMGKSQLEQLSKIIDGFKEKEKNKDLYDKVNKIKKFKIIELEQLLEPILEKDSYIKLNFKDPEISKDVMVSFTVHDSKPDRIERVSSHDLKKLLNKTLIDTNWRLMSDGVNYRLGMLSGRLKAYEREEDLVKLIK